MKRSGGEVSCENTSTACLKEWYWPTAHKGAGGGYATCEFSFLRSSLFVRLAPTARGCQELQLKDRPFPPALLVIPLVPLTYARSRQTQLLWHPEAPRSSKRSHYARLVFFHRKPTSLSIWQHICSPLCIALANIFSKEENMKETERGCRMKDLKTPRDSQTSAA